jgi:hypothetical protein
LGGVMLALGCVMLAYGGWSLVEGLEHRQGGEDVVAGSTVDAAAGLVGLILGALLSALGVLGLYLSGKNQARRRP